MRTSSAARSRVRSRPAAAGRNRRRGPPASRRCASWTEELHHRRANRSMRHIEISSMMITLRRRAPCGTPWGHRGRRPPARFSACGGSSSRPWGSARRCRWAPGRGNRRCALQVRYEGVEHVALTRAGVAREKHVPPVLSALSASACSGVKRSPSAISISRHPFDQ